MRVDPSPTARALLALESLQDYPGISADRLARRLDVSGRAVRRYVGILREAGIPIESIRGPGGGYRLGRGRRPLPLLFGSQEALGLVMAVLDGHHDAGDPNDPVGSAIGKLLRALPEAVAAQANALRRAAAPAPDRGAARPDAATTVALVQASADRRCVRLRYRSEAGKELDIVAEPWAVVVRHSRWYLLCLSVTSGAARAYRVDRVRDVEVLDETFVPPADLDPVAALEEHLAIGWEYDVDVVIDAPVEKIGRFVRRELGRLERVDDRTTRLRGSTSNPAWYVGQLVEIPSPFKIVGSREILAAARLLADRLAAAVATG